MSRTVSARIPKESHEKLRECCNNEGISINDFIKTAIENTLPYGMSDKNAVILRDKNNIEYVRKKISEFEPDEEGNQLTPDDIFSMLIDDSVDRERLESLVEKKNQSIRQLESTPIDYEQAFLHLKDCNKCRNAIVGKGYTLVSLEELKKYNLVPRRNPV